MSTCLEIEVSIKIKYGHEGIMTILITTTYIYFYRLFAWGQARSKLGGVDTSILHHAFISIFIALWDVITHYVTILMPFLSYFTRFTWRGRMPVAWILGWKSNKYYRPILHSSKSLETSWKTFSEYIKKYSAEEIHHGGHTLPTRVGARPTPLGTPPALWAPRGSPGQLLSPI